MASYSISMVKPNGEKLTVLNCPADPLSIHVVKEILSGRAYRCPPVLSPGPVVVLDVGANVGAAAAYFLAHYPEAIVRCYEPSAEAFELLSANLGRFPRVRCLNYGLLDESRQVTLFRGNNSTVTASIYPNSDTRSEGTVVQLMDAKQEIEQNRIARISILKVDTEGCEVRIIERILSLPCPVDCILFEYHSEKMRRRLDARLADGYGLYFSASSDLHRGTCGYLAWPLIRERRDLCSREMSDA